MSPRALLLLVLAFAAAMLGVGMPGFSSATLTDSSTNTATVRAAADWTPPTVSVQNPGATVSGTTTLTAVAADGETGVQSVTIEYRARNASSWVTVCTDASAPYTCSWNTTNVADGSYDLRARATDNADYSTTSATLSTTVANAVVVLLSDPGDFVRGTVSVTATVLNGGGLNPRVEFQYSPAGDNDWDTICTDYSAPFACSAPTQGMNGTFDLRAVAVSGATSYYSAVLSDVTVDNTSPIVTMTNPGSPLRGITTFGATASDVHSDVAEVVLQYAAPGQPYVGFCTLSSAPYTCAFDTTTMANATYSFRAIATDEAGNSTTSANVNSRVVDNTGSSVTMQDPGAFLSDTVTLRANASAGTSVTSVRIQRTASGTTNWADVCTDNSAPYSCAWNTTGVADGLYDFRAVLLDGAGTTTTSNVLSARRVDNTPLTAFDVQTTNADIAGKVDSGDTITFTYSERVNLATVTPGWAGGTQAVTVRLRDKDLIGGGPGSGAGDTLDVQRSGSSVNLGSANLIQHYIRKKKTATWAATMTSDTDTAGGVTRTTVTVTLGNLATGKASELKAAKSAAAMIWTPSAAVTDLLGRACSTAPRTEPGNADKDF